jgi:hypothetical protein
MINKLTKSGSLIIRLMILLVLSGFTGLKAQTDPALYNGWPANYTFTSWDAAEAAGTYPANMRFWRTGTQDPSIVATANADYTTAYNGASGTRINGLGADGISFVNTGTAGNLGMAVVGLNLSGRNNVQVSWTGGTVAAQPREYKIRLQYRIGAGAWTDVPGPVEYSSNATSGHSQAFGPTTLPAAVDNQSAVYVRWFYFYSGPTTGTRPQLRLDDITISSSGAVGPNLTWSAGSLTGFNTISGTASASQSANISGTSLLPSAGNILITAPAGYEVFNGISWVSSYNIAYTGGELTSTPVQIRVAASNPPGFPSGAVTAAGGGATTANLTVSGSVTGSFTAGNIAILRAIGTSNVATSLVIDEYNTSGTWVQTLNAPTAVAGPNRRITQSASATSEGALGISPDKRFLTFVGYDANVGTAAIASTDVATVNRVIGFVGNDGEFNTSTYIDNAFTGNNIRAGYTIDGNNFWATGASGIQYVALGTPSPSVNIATSNTRNLAASNTQLYVSSASGSFTGLNRVGTGFPTTSATVTNFINSALANNPNAFSIFDADPLVPGEDLAYVANVNGIFKFSFNGTIWVAQGSLTGTNIYHVTAVPNGGNYDLYATVGIAGGNTIYKLTDLAAYDAPITGNGTALTTTGTLFATAPAGTVFRGVQPAPEDVPVPDITHTFTTPGTTTIAQGANNAILQRIQLNVTNADALFTGMTVQTTGTYAPADVVQFKLIYSTDATLDLSDITLGTIITSTGPGQNLTFGPFGQNITIGNRYLFIVADISGCAVAGNEIGLTATPLTNINYATANKTGTPAASTLKEFIAGLPANVTALAVPSLIPTIEASWTNPSCFDYVMVVVHTAPSIAAPALASYGFNTTYNLAPAYPGGGRVVYQGTANNISVINVPTGSTYYIRVFTRNSGLWSTGVQVSAFIDNVTYYSRGSGNAQTAAIWATSPTGTGATISSLGGFLSNRNIVIQTGDVVEFTTGSSYPCLNFTVQSGAQAYANATTGMRYITPHGNITNNGIIGNGTTIDALGFNIEGTTCLFSGSGTTNLSRIRKTFNTNPTSTLTIAKNINLRWNDITAAMYNDANNTTFNIILNQNRTLAITDPISSLAIDGTDGASPNERGGNFTINGILNVAGRVIARNNNTTFACSFIIGATGRVNTEDIDVDIASAGVGFPFTINSGGQLNVTGRLKVWSGTLNSNNGISLRSSFTSISNTKTALVDVTGGGVGSISGNVNVERRYGVLAAATAHMSSPVSGADIESTVTGWRDDYTFTANTATMNYGPGVPGFFYEPVPVGFTSSTNFPRIWEWVEDHYSIGNGAGLLTVPSGNNTNPISNITGWKAAVMGPIVVGKGYSVTNVPNNRTFDVFGTVNNGAVSVPVTNTNAPTTPWSATDGLNLVGNPYPSPINWDLMRDGSDNLQLGQIYQVFKNTGTGAGNYGTYDASTNTGTIGTTATIPSSQGFLVQCVPSSGNVNFLNAHRTNNPLNAGNNLANINNFASIRLALRGGAGDDETLIILDNQFQDAFSQVEDAVKMMASVQGVPSLYTIDGVKRMSLNKRSSISDETIIPLGVFSQITGTYEIELTEIMNLASSAMIYLEDLQNGTLQNLRSNPLFTANISNGNIDNRFRLIMRPAVEINTVSASCAGNDGKVIVNYPSTGNGISAELKNENGASVAYAPMVNGSYTFENVISGNYSVEFTFSDGFTAVDYVSISGGNGVSASLLASTNAVNLESNMPVTFTANVLNATSINWNFGDGTIISNGPNVVNHTYTQPGQFVVTLEAMNSQCNSISTTDIEVLSPTGIYDATAQGVLINGIGNRLFVQFNNIEDKQAHIEVMNLLGQSMISLEANTGSGKQELQVNNAATGQYIVRVTTTNKVYTQKVYLTK